MATHIRCYACGAFFSISEPCCVECDAPRRARNGTLETARLNNHLFAQAEQADKQRNAERAIRAGHELRGDPPKWAKRRAAELIDQL